MSEHEALHQALGRFLGDSLPADATRDVNAALLLAEALEKRGFGFRLFDARPRDPATTLWRAAFSGEGRRFEREDPDAALAVCRAALAALQG